MPKDFLYETAITIEHEDGIMRVDTTVTSVATALERAGFIEKTKANSRPYRRFLGQADQIRFRKPKGHRKTTAGSFGSSLRTRPTGEKPTQISPISPEAIAKPG